MNKYKLTENFFEHDSRKLYQIKALKDFDGVEKGDLGGYIESEDNLSQNGTSWVCGNAKVYGNARVAGNAWVSDNAKVYGNAQVYGTSEVYGNAQVSGTTQVYGDAWISENAKVYGNAKVFENAKVYGNAKVSGIVQVHGDSEIFEFAGIQGQAEIDGYIDQHQPGAKLDSGKLRPYLVQNGFRNAFQELYKNGTFGANKYTDYGWESVPNARERYMDAAERHKLAWLLGEERDEESDTHHLVASAWNLLAVAELELRREGSDLAQFVKKFKDGFKDLD